MRDNFDAIPLEGCNFLSSSTSISNYRNGVRSDYVLYGGKWILTRTSDYDRIPNSYSCVDITNLGSSNAGFEPIYEYFNLILAIGIFVFCIWLIFGKVFKRL